jgi:hypothetical protein
MALLRGFLRDGFITGGFLRFCDMSRGWRMRTRYKSVILNGGKAERTNRRPFNGILIMRSAWKKRFAIYDIKWLVDLSEVL